MEGRKCKFLAPVLIAIMIIAVLTYKSKWVLNVSLHDGSSSSNQEQGLLHQTTPALSSSAIFSSLEKNPIPNDATLNKMGVGDLSDLFHGYTMSTQTLCNRRLRMGKVQDGGWDVCDDPRYKPTRKNCVVYSFGISNDYSYDDAVAKYYECEVHSFDPSMKNTPDHLRGKYVHFHQVGIGRVNTNVTGKWRLFTLGTLREQYHHKPSERAVDIVKMDVEGAELSSLFKAIEEGSLKDVRQLSFETHMRLANGDPQRVRVTEFLKLLRKLWDEGFRLYHANRNISPVNIYNSRIHQVPRTACHELYMLNIRRKRFN